MMDRDLFIETIDALKTQSEHDLKCSEAFRVILPNDHISNYNNNVLIKQTINILQVLMNDTGKDSWIDYYIYELDFGKRYRHGMATESDGANIDFSDAGALYDFIHQNNPVHLQ